MFSRRRVGWLKSLGGERRYLSEGRSPAIGACHRMSALPPIRRILSVNTSDQGGGAEQVACHLFRAFASLGWDSRLAVGNRTAADERVIAIHSSPYVDHTPHQNPLILALQERLRAMDRRRGYEDFHYPLSGQLLSLAGFQPDVVLFHNLHGGYFDLGALPKLARAVPVFLVLHDCWLLTGHCGQPVHCERWRHGCGDCPDLSLPPSIEADGTAFNWLRKKAILQSLRCFVATPTEWLLTRARESILAPSMLNGRVIPCPIDPRSFFPGGRVEARSDLGLPNDEIVFVFAANQARSNPYKDSETTTRAVEWAARQRPEQALHFVSIGEAGPPRSVGHARFTSLAYLPHDEVARWLRAADIYLHAARAENFGLVTAEAQACGTPVIATNVGGLSEVIVDGETGLLTPAGDAEAMGRAIVQFIDDPERRRRLGENAGRRAHALWREERVVALYREWFEEGQQIWSARSKAA